MARPPSSPDAPAPGQSPADASPVADFEQSLDALEALVEQMERGEMSLEESLAAYERGVAHGGVQALWRSVGGRQRAFEDGFDPYPPRGEGGLRHRARRRVRRCRGPAGR